MLGALKKYIYLYWAFFRASFTADLEFRLNFALHILSDLCWYLAQIAGFEVIFRQTTHLGGWNVEQMRVFLGLLFVTDALYMIIFSSSVDRFSDKVRRGDLDLLLAKPVSSQFIMSCQRVATASIGNLLFASGWLVWSLSQLQSGTIGWKLLWLLLLIPCGLVVMYSSRFSFSVAAVVFTNAENLQYLWHQVFRLGTRPDVIYKPWLKYLVLTAVPVGLIASVPARALMEPNNPPLYAWALFVAALCLFATKKFWQYALRNYTSASS